MHIVAAMTRYAGTCLLHRGSAGLVAALAGQIPVCALERKIGLLIVIELPAVPADRIVAIGAGRTEPATVNIVVRMAIAAGVGQRREYQALMTLLTAGGAMHPYQREADEIVLESGYQSPLGRFVTVPAAAEGLAMRVGRPMTAFAGPGQFIGPAAPVTVTAHQRLMHTQQGIVGFSLMIEAHFPAFLIVTIGTQGTIAAKMRVVP